MIIQKENLKLIEKVKNPKEYFGINYVIHHYDGCLNKCIYCSRKKENDFNIEIPKTLTEIESFLFTHSNKYIMGFAPLGDPYQWIETKYHITSQILSLLERFHYSVCIVTKSKWILNDLETLISMNNQAKVAVIFEFTTMDEKMAKILEPNASSVEERLKAMQTLNHYGILTGISLNPILPFITDKKEEMKKIVKAAKLHGAKFIFPIYGATFTKSQKRYFYHKLEKTFPSVIEKYKETYHDDYFCYLPNAKKISSFLKEECYKNGLFYNPEYLFKLLKEKEEQLQLF